MSQSRLSIIPSEAVSDQRLSHVQLRVLLAIGSFTGKDRAAFPKQRTLATLLGLSRETVNRAIATLKELGYVEVHKQERPDGGQKENLYWVKLDPAGQPPCDFGVTPPVTLEDHTPRDATQSHLRTIHINDTSVSEDTDDATIPEQPKRNGRVRGSARKTQIPPDWQPSAANYAFASQSGLSRQEINHEADQFRNSAVANGRRYADWHAAFRTWLGNAVKWRAERAAKSPAGAQPGGKPRGGGLVSAGLRAVSEARGYGEQVPARGGVGAGYVIDGDEFRLTGD